MKDRQTDREVPCKDEGQTDRQSGIHKDEGQADKQWYPVRMKDRQIRVVPCGDDRQEDRVVSLRMKGWQTNRVVPRKDDRQTDWYLVMMTDRQTEWYL